MDVMDFIVKDEIIELNIQGCIFKYKPANSGDEISWFKDYSEVVDKSIIDESTGKERKVQIIVTNEAKLSLCKLRNIVEVPFTKEQIKQICGIDKEFNLFTNEEKDLFFKKFEGPIYNKLIIEIDSNKSSKKELPH